MTTESFVYETSNNRAQRIAMVAILVMLVLGGIVTFLTNVDLGTPTEAAWYEKYVPDIAHDITPTKVFLISLFGAMIFFPIPAELAFVVSIHDGNPVLICFAAAVIGFTLGHAVNYAVGRQLSNQALYLLSAKKFYGLRRQVNRWGAYAVVVLNMFPAPSDLLTVGLGTMRYNVKRLFVLITIGNIIKFAILAYAANALIGVL